MARRTQADAALRERAAAVIPGGMYGHESTALLPAEFPQFFARAKGARLWDADGNEYLDFMCAYGPNLLGYADPEIDAAFTEQLARGDAMTGPSPLLVELAEQLVTMVAHAQWAMFCKNGTDATSMAVAVARAHTKRRKILLAKGAYHGAAAWCTPNPLGTLPDDRAHLIPFAYNDVASLERAAREAEGDLAGVLVSPFKHDGFVDQELPTREFAHAARAVCDRAKALLIMDEVRGGFRLSRSGSWTPLGVEPDLSAWGKCLANGHPLSALLGSEVARSAASRIYTTGSFWFAAAPMAAALATLRRIRESDYLERTQRLGDAPCLRDAGLGAPRFVGVVDLGDLAETSLGEGVEQRLQGRADLGFGVVGEVARAQHRFAVRAHEPGPDRAVVIGTVAAHHVALEARSVVGVLA